MKACYFDPRSEETVEVVVDSPSAVIALLHELAAVTSGRGRPAVEILRDDGSSLVISQDEARAFLVWVDPLGGSHHSVGGVGHDSMVFDYFGSWSEAPADQLIPIDHLGACVMAFVNGGSPASEAVLFTPE